MTLKYFNVKNGLSTGNITLNAGNSNVTANYFNGTGSILTGNINAGNANLGNLVTANYFIGDGGLLSNITIAASNSIVNGNSNVSVNANSNVTVSVAGSSNIATFAVTGLTLSGNLIVGNKTNLGNVSNVTITGGNNGQVLTTDGAGNLSFTNGTSYSTVYVDTFTGNGVQTQFTLSTSPTSINTTSVNYNGVILLRNAYSIDGNILTFGSIPANGSNIEVTTTQYVAGGAGSFVTRAYTGDGTTANYSVTSGSTDSSVLATLDGIMQTPTIDYTISGTVLTFGTAPELGVLIQIRELAVVQSTTGVSTGKSIAMAIVFGF